MTSTVLDYQNDQAVKRLCIVNRLKESTLTDNEIITVCKAIQDQLRNEFMKYHGFSAKLYYCPKAVAEPNNMWNMYLLDTAEGGGYLGYHDANQNGIPQSKTFVKTAEQAGAMWSCTLSHEILEALCDPWGMDNFFSDAGLRKRLVAWEVCDPVEADKYSYRKNGIGVSNFVTPYWKHPFNDTGELDSNIRYDLLNQLTRSFQTLRGCHQSYYYISGGPNGQQGWTEKTFHSDNEDLDEKYSAASATSASQDKTNIQAKALNNINEFIEDVKLEDVQNMEIYSESIMNSNWHIGFKFPSQDMISKFDITKEEVKEAVDSAFHPPAGSRRDIRFKMSLGGFKALLKNESKEKLKELNNITKESNNVYAVDKSFE